jgi:hypothetical protein
VLVCVPEKELVVVTVDSHKPAFIGKLSANDGNVANTMVAIIPAKMIFIFKF